VSEPVATRLAYLAGVVLGTVVASSVFFVLSDLAGASDQPRGGDTDFIDYLILALLVILAVYVFLRRKVSEPPKWMGKLQTATPQVAFRLGLLLFLFMPTDLITTFTVGATLARNSESLLWAIPFVLLTAFFVAIPLLILLLLGHRADAILPKIREWMSDNSWVVSELVILLFVLITLSGM
jgi:hypothetical protein